MHLSSFRIAVLSAVAGLAGLAAGSPPAQAGEPVTTAAVTTSALTPATLTSATLTPAALTPAEFNPHNFTVPVGRYHCELNRNVDVREVSPDLANATLRFDNKEYRLRAVRARTGALRYEDEQAGVVWLVITGKSMLLDTRHGKQLANECRA